MKKILYVAFILVVSFACKTDAEEQAVDFNDLSKPSEKYAHGDSSGTKAVQLPVYYDSVSVLSQRLIDSLGLDKKRVFTLDTLILPDRFGALKTDKWYYLSGKDSLVFMLWEFKNLTLTQNAFFNWLDCYGSNCKSIAVGDKTGFSKRATLFLQQDKELIFVESGQKINGEKMVSILSEIRKRKSWQHFVLQQPRGKAVWKYIDEEGMVSDAVVLEGRLEIGD